MTRRFATVIGAAVVSAIAIVVAAACSANAPTVDPAPELATEASDEPTVDPAPELTTEAPDAAPDSPGEDYCMANPASAECDEFFDSLSDEEFCRLLPDADFCADMTGTTEEPTPAPPVRVNSSPGLIAVAGANPTLTRPDGQCLPDTDDIEVELVVAYQVVDGTLGAVCHGDAEPIVEGAWAILADLTPPAQLTDLAIFAGFDTADDSLLAFVQRTDEDGSEFMMAVNVVETEADPDEATLTMAHEFTHVFTATVSELDPYIAAGECDTFDNGQGCYVEESIMNQWYETFWTRAPGDPTDESDGGARCDLDAGFFGSYAASTPEEDFAEAFSAYVLQIDARNSGQQARLDFIDGYPGLREFRDRAVTLGYGPLDHTFDECG